MFDSSGTPKYFGVYRGFFRSSKFMTVGNVGSVDVNQEKSESGFNWLKSSTRCGLIVHNVDLAWSGTWKCHLADTSSSAAGEQIR